MYCTNVLGSLPDMIWWENGCNDGPEMKAICCETPVSSRDKPIIVKSNT